jgi:hypothetical protein
VFRLVIDPNDSAVSSLTGDNRHAQHWRPMPPYSHQHILRARRFREIKSWLSEPLTVNIQNANPRNGPKEDRRSATEAAGNV